MAKRYVFVRMPFDTYKRYVEIQKKMQLDLMNMTGKNIRLPMTKVFNAVASPKFNENFIQVDLRKLNEFIRKGR